MQHQGSPQTSTSLVTSLSCLGAIATPACLGVWVQVHGKVLELAQNHTASRIIQFCIKYGSAEQKAAIMAEVRASIVELAKSKHGHYLVQKLVTAAKKEDITGKHCTRLFRGGVRVQR